MRHLKMLAFATVLSLTSMLYAQAPSDAQIQGEVQHALGNKRFANVEAAVQDGVVCEPIG